jgi:hypothetical protein
MTCEHEDFAAKVVVNRLEDVNKFRADVTIRCAQCGTPFQFLGLPGGLYLDGATVSVDRLEAWLAIAPCEEWILTRYSQTMNTI